MNNKRNTQVDVMRGFGILLVIMGHVYAPHILKYIICSFHMPLFFIISGYYFKPERAPSEVAEKGLKRLLVPYIFTCLCIIVIEVIVALVKNDDIGKTFYIWFIASLYGLPGRLDIPNISEIERIGAIWFFEALFWAQIELSIVSKVKGIKRQIGLVTTIFLSAYFVSAYFWFPLNIGTGLTTAVFLYIGYLIKKYNIMEKDNRNWMVIAISLSSICVIIAFIKGKPFVPAYLEYPLYGFDIIGGVSGTYLMYLLSKYICKKSKRLVKVLSYIGNRTTEILCFHLIDQDCLSLLLPLPNSNILRLIIRLIIDIVGGIGLHLLLQKERNYNGHKASYKKGLSR